MNSQVFVLAGLGVVTLVGAFLWLIDGLLEMYVEGIVRPIVDREIQWAKMELRSELKSKSPYTIPSKRGH